MRPDRHPAPPPSPDRPSSRGGAGKPRELSITTLFRASTRTRTGETAVPYLPLSGHWLEQHGFTRLPRHRDPQKRETRPHDRRPATLK
ncbi:MAG TPA: hypothetical protein VGF28_13275 [Thermoanaerobaculia bacterium]|jgi:hypothetical protein